MATSGTFAWDPEIAEFTDEAWERCGIDPQTLVSKHLVSTRRSLNFLFADWATKGDHQFVIDEQTQLLTAGDVDYAPATGTVSIVQAFLRRSGLDTPVHRIDREQYAAIPDKTQRGMPDQVFHDRKAGLYYLWMAPENSTDTLHYWRVRRMQDVTAAQETADLNFLWFEALASGLAAKLALKWAPARLSILEPAADAAYLRAKTGERERADTTMEPG